VEKDKKDPSQLVQEKAPNRGELKIKMWVVYGLIVLRSNRLKGRERRNRREIWGNKHYNN